MRPLNMRQAAEAQQEREKAAAFSKQIGSMLLRAAMAAFDAAEYAHTWPAAYSLKDAIQRAREAADAAVEYQWQVDKAKMAITPASILRAETGKEGGEC